MTESTGLKLKYLESQLEMLTVLGASDSKRVFLCRDKRNGKIVVKKYVSPAVCSVYEKLKNISNIHIAAVYETAFDDKEGIVVEEFINGYTLREFTQIYGLPDRQSLCRIVCDICSALSQTHRLGIIHRDINPDNIMISNDGVLKIIDFGIARMLKERSPQDTAQYAIDNINADWNANALATAKNYQDTMAMSPEAIRDQLTSDYPKTNKKLNSATRKTHVFNTQINPFCRSPLDLFCSFNISAKSSFSK